MEEETREQIRQEEYGPWERWQEDWFGTPGDVDDFIFYHQDRGDRIWPEE